MKSTWRAKIPIVKQIDKETPPKFKKGDHVRIGNITPDEAIIRETTTRTYSTDKISYAYSVFFKGRGSSAWYEEEEIVELVAKDQHKLLEKWQNDVNEVNAKKADLDWIFSNVIEVRAEEPSSSMKTLGKHLGIENMWGKYGEGTTYLYNCRMVLKAAEPFLNKRDKKGFMEFCKHNKVFVFEERTTTTIPL